jgi:hypothetical protein
MRKQGNYHRPFGIGCNLGEFLSHGGIIAYSIENEESALCECTVFVSIEDM